MKAKVKGNVEGYTPKTIEITLESLSEEKGFRHLYGCSFENPTCSRLHEVKEVQRELNRLLNEQLEA